MPAARRGKRWDGPEVLLRVCEDRPFEDRQGTADQPVIIGVCRVVPKRCMELKGEREGR